jgi:FKBP-type peptidyl-prolyl cis-trans isomerase
VKKAPKGAARPRPWDKVTVGYTGWDASGMILDSSEIHGSQVTMQVDRLPPIFVDVVPALAAGERARMWFPGTMLARGKNIPPGMVCFEAEVTEVIALHEPPPAPPDVAKPPAGAQKTPRGVSYKVLKASGNAQKPTSTDLVTVKYTGWQTDGKRFDSTVPEGITKQYRLTGVIPGWADALPLMSVGDVWRLWIPEELAYKGQEGRPQGMLVFDVELVAAEPVRKQ